MAKSIIQLRIKLPSWVKQSFPLVKTVSINACGQSGRRFSRNYAHAYNDSRDRLCGHICILEEAWDANSPTNIFLHEYAHLQVGISGHGKRWQKAYEKLCAKWGETPDYSWM